MKAVPSTKSSVNIPSSKTRATRSLNPFCAWFVPRILLQFILCGEPYMVSMLCGIGADGTNPHKQMYVTKYASHKTIILRIGRAVIDIRYREKCVCECVE